MPSARSRPNCVAPLSVLLCGIGTTTAACSLLTSFSGLTGSQVTDAGVIETGGFTPDASDGTIGTECPTGLTLCSGTCVDTTSDNSNCAQCGNACIASHCASGACQFDCAGTVSVLNGPIADGTYVIVSSPSALPLDDPGGVGAGTGLDLYPYTGPNQQWTVARVAGGQYKILAQNGLAVTSQGLGSPLELAPYSGANTQIWGIVADGPDYNVVNTSACLAMDDEGAPIYSFGVDVTAYDPSNRDQFWSFGSAASMGLCGNNAQACCSGNACVAPSTACLSAATSTCRTPPPVQCACGVLYQGMLLQSGETLSSCDDRFSLTLANGNLTLSYSGTTLWSSGTTGSGATYAHMQDDGDFVLYAEDGGAAQWASGTAGLGCGAYLDVQTDGNLVLYDSSQNPRWSSGTCCH